MSLVWQDLVVAQATLPLSDSPSSWGTLSAHVKCLLVSTTYRVPGAGRASLWLQQEEMINMRIRISRHALVPLWSCPALFSLEKLVASCASPSWPSIQDRHTLRMASQCRVGVWPSFRALTWHIADVTSCATIGAVTVGALILVKLLLSSCLGSWERWHLIYGYLWNPLVWYDAQYDSVYAVWKTT